MLIFYIFSLSLILVLEVSAVNKKDIDDVLMSIEECSKSISARKKYNDLDRDEAALLDQAIEVRDMLSDLRKKVRALENSGRYVFGKNYSSSTHLKVVKRSIKDLDKPVRFLLGEVRSMLDVR